MYSRKGPQPMSSDEYAAHLADRARERQRRGMVSFTRPGQAERILGKVPESPMGQRARESQVTKRARTRGKR